MDPHTGTASGCALHPGCSLTSQAGGFHGHRKEGCSSLTLRRQHSSHDECPVTCICSSLHISVCISSKS